MLNKSRRSFFGKAGIGAAGALTISLVPFKKVFPKKSSDKISSGLKNRSLIHPLAIKRNNRG